MTISIKNNPAKPAGRIVTMGSGGGISTKYVPPPPPPAIVSSGLVLYLDASNPASYPGAGTTWYDLSGNGNHAAAQGTPTYTATNGGGFTFNSVSDYFDLTPNLRESYVGTGLSVAAWAKANTLPYVSAIVSRANWNNPDGWALHQHFTNALHGPRYYNAKSPDGTVLASTIYYLAFTIDSSGTAKVFINGSQSGATSSGVSLPTTAIASPIIGEFEGGNFPWDGDIYEVHTYNRGLSDAEVLSNFNGSKARFGL